MSTYSRCFRGDFTSLSEEQKLRSVLKTMDNMMLEVSNNKYVLLEETIVLVEWVYWETGLEKDQQWRMQRWLEGERLGKTNG